MTDVQSKRIFDLCERLKSINARVMKKRSALSVHIDLHYE